MGTARARRAGRGTAFFTSCLLTLLASSVHCFQFSGVRWWAGRPGVTRGGEDESISAFQKAPSWSGKLLPATSSRCWRPLSAAATLAARPRRMKVGNKGGASRAQS